MWLVVGLGNPGREYAGNRHNIGFEVVAELAARAKAPPMREKFGAELAEATLRGERVLLCKPMEFMNASGQPVARVAKFWKIAPESTIVVHDDLDLPFGRLKLGAGGGHGGNNGVRSLLADLGTADFLRVRFGIGRPAPGADAAGYVLTDFSRAEQKDLPDLRMQAADAVEEIIAAGLTAAMNRFNTRKNDDKSDKKAKSSEKKSARSGDAS
ncbi:MAG TPA: aminoacyl-tRNA hydrolase [Polyangia bacterium]|jgi:PTH1 family peptidyl-tRNA hydrolase|nr:aminoacyl-tRNA hydrolase [Polyangia bacterium]